MVPVKKPHTLLSRAALLRAQKRCCVLPDDHGARLPMDVLLRRRSLRFQAPDVLAGRWEAPDGHGGAVGMNITLTTHINGTPRQHRRPTSVRG